MFSWCLSDSLAVAGAGEVLVRPVEAESLPRNVDPGPLKKLTLGVRPPSGGGGFGLQVSA